MRIWMHASLAAAAGNVRPGAAVAIACGDHHAPLRGGLRPAHCGRVCTPSSAAGASVYAPWWCMCRCATGPPPPPQRAAQFSPQRHVHARPASVGCRRRSATPTRRHTHHSHPKYIHRTTQGILQSRIVGYSPLHARYCWQCACAGRVGASQPMPLSLCRCQLLLPCQTARRHGAILGVLILHASHATRMLGSDEGQGAAGWARPCRRRAVAYDLTHGPCSTPLHSAPHAFARIRTNSCR